MSSALDFELYDTHEPDAYLTFADYQNIYEAEHRQQNGGGGGGGHDNSNDSGGGGYSTGHPMPTDSMAAIRMSVLLAQNADPHQDRFALGFEPTAADLLHPMHPAEEERQITRMLRRVGIEADRSCEPNGGAGMRMAATRQSAYGKAPTRLAVAGLRNVYIDDSYFLATADRTLAEVAGADEERRPAADGKEQKAAAAVEVAAEATNEEQEQAPAAVKRAERVKKMPEPKQPSEKEGRQSAKTGKKAQQKFYSCKEVYMKKNMRSMK